MDRPGRLPHVLYYLFSILIIPAVLVSIPQPTRAYPNEKKIFRDAKLYLNIYGVFEDTIQVMGTTDLGWSDPYFNGEAYVMDQELTGMKLYNTNDSTGGVSINCNGGIPSLGLAEMLGPGGDFPADSFFDIFLKIILDDILPGDTLHNNSPLHIVSTVDAMPPYFDPFEIEPIAPVYLYDQGETVVGEMTYWWEEVTPHSCPEAHVSVETSKGSEVAIAGNDTIRFDAAMSGYLEPQVGMLRSQPEPQSVTFGIRPAGSPSSFQTFWTDYDGDGCEIGTIAPMREGDGWCGYLDVSSYPYSGGYYEVEARFSFSGYPVYRDTVTAYIDPTPPIPGLVDFPPDSIGYCGVDCMQRIIFEVPDEDIDTVKVRVLLLKKESSRALAVVDQFGLNRFGAFACSAAALGSCLKYWAGNGYDELDHEDGDTGKPEQNAEDIANEIENDIQPDPAQNGAQASEIKAGVDAYLARHGCEGWDVSNHDVNDYSDIAEMMEEFEADSEDVIIYVCDTVTVNGQLQTLGHAVTMGSRESTYYEEQHGGGMWGCVSHKVDFMDPQGGGSQQDNEYEINEDEKGRPVTEGYSNIGNPNSNSRIFGYLKVSPPEEGAKIARSGRYGPHPGPRDGSGVRPQLKAPALNHGEWITVDAGPGKGNGELDTLTWDTTDFTGGLYLLEVRAIDFEGHEGRAIRLAGVPEYTVDAEGPETPQPYTGIRSSYPNPFNPSTTIEYSLGKKTEVSLLIFDVSGRLVRRLIDGEVMEAGPHHASWDGLNDGGRRLASGVYFCMLKTKYNKASRKMILLR